jgi:Mrp family chromosome partitioning ATPase
MANPKNYKALLIRADARAAIDEAKKAHFKVTGIDLNYSQFVKMICDDYVREMQEQHPQVRLEDSSNEQ